LFFRSKTMPLNTFVKVGSITSLSDARYCAGMGVDLLGFRVIQGQDNYISPSRFQEIRGWIAGPEIVAEIYGITSSVELEAILADYKPDYLELGSAEAELLGDLSIPYILSTNKEDPKPVSTRQPAFLLLKKLSANSSLFRCLVEVQSYVEVQRAQEFSHFGGIALKGSAEIRPGLKDYDEMAEILEKLDIE